MDDGSDDGGGGGSGDAKMFTVVTGGAVPLTDTSDDRGTVTGEEEGDEVVVAVTEVAGR